MSEILFLDTSAVLDGALKAPYNEDSRIYISTIVLNELEKIKNSDRGEHIKYLAREAVREILNHQEYLKDSLNLARIPDYRTQKKFFKKYPFLEHDLNDHRLLLEAVLLHNQRNEMVFFVTSDATLWLFAKQITELNEYNGVPILYEPKQEKKIEYKGWVDCYPNTEELASIYSEPTKNVLNAKTNQFCKIYEGLELRDVVFWDGEKYSPLKYKNFSNQLGEKVSPRNIEQKMLFHLLQDDNIKIKLCIGGFGDGKTWSMLQHALKGIKEGRFSKIIYVRNNIITRGSRDIGYLGGDLVEKIRPYLMPIADLTTPEYMDELIETGVLEPVPLAFMRGRDFSSDVLVFCDEAENLTKENVQLLIGRIGEGSQLWFAGDLKQIDNTIFEKNNGLTKMIDCLAGNELFGMVRLVKSERSKTSQCADLLD